MLRWLLPIVTAIAVLGAATAAYAGAGFKRVVACCCPDPDTCKCPDHKQAPNTPTMERCHGAVKFVAPAAAVAVASPPFEVIATPVAITLVVHPVVAMPPDRATRPEKPPF